MTVQKFQKMYKNTKDFQELRILKGIKLAWIAY